MTHSSKPRAAEGAAVVVNYASSKSGADKIVDEITTACGKAVAVGGDVSKAAEAQGIIDLAIKHFGHLDILVNNSGVYEFAPIEDITEDQFHRQFNINVLGLLLTTQAAVKHLNEGASTSTLALLSAASHLQPVPFIAAPRVLLMPSRVYFQRNSVRGKSASIRLTLD